MPHTEAVPGDPAHSDLVVRHQSTPACGRDDLWVALAIRGRRTRNPLVRDAILKWAEAVRVFDEMDAVNFLIQDDADDELRAEIYERIEEHRTAVEQARRQMFRYQARAQPATRRPAGRTRLGRPIRRVACEGRRRPGGRRPRRPSRSAGGGDSSDSDGPGEAGAPFLLTGKSRSTCDVLLRIIGGAL